MNLTTIISKLPLKSGHVFVYKEDECAVEILKDDDGKAVMVYDRETVDKLLNTPDNGAYTFVYTNPFLISVNKTPNAIGIYKNIVSHDFQLDYVTLKEMFLGYYLKFPNMSYRCH